MIKERAACENLFHTQFCRSWLVFNGKRPLVVPLSVFISYLMVNTNILFFDSETRTFLKYIMMMPLASPSSCVLPEAFFTRHIEERTRTVQKDLVVLNIWCLLSTLRHPLHLFLSPFIAANCCPNKKSVMISLYSSNDDWIH